MHLSILYIFIGLLCGLLFSACLQAEQQDERATSALKQLETDTDNHELDFGIEGEGDLDLFDDISLDEEDENFENDNQHKTNFFDGRFIYQQEFSYRVNSPSSVQTNRSSLQLQWGKSLPKDFYAHVDVIYNLFLNNDTRISADKSIGDESNIRNVYLQKNWGDTNLSLGYQIIVWGESETSVVTDVFSPRNQTDFIFTSLEQSRLSQFMFKLDHYSSIGQFTFIVNPDVEVNRNPFTQDSLGNLVLQQKDKDFETELGFRWHKTIGRGDYSLFAADLYDNQVTYQYLDTVNDNIVVENQHDRYQMLAAASNYTFGNSAIQTELAYNFGRNFQTIGPYSELNNGILKSDQIQLSTSYNYTQGGTRTWLFGVSTQYLKNNKNPYLPKKYRNTTDMVFSVSESFWYQTLDISYTLLYQFKNKSEIHRLTSKYKVRDDLSLEISAFYLNGATGDKSNSILARLRYFF